MQTDTQIKEIQIKMAKIIGWASVVLGFHNGTYYVNENLAYTIIILLLKRQAYVN